MDHTSPSFRELTTFRVGGDIRAVQRVRTSDKLFKTIRHLDEAGEQVVILGGGSNVLPSDEYFNGTVVVVATDGITYEEKEGSVHVVVEAGVPWDSLVRDTISKNYWGLENLSGIPGSVGAAPIQNIGAYGAQVSETILWVEVYDRTLKEIKKLSKDELDFGYRTSVFKKNPNRYVVIRVAFVLEKNGTPRISYKDLTQYFEHHSHPTLNDVREAVLSIRTKKFPDLNEVGTAGSFFMNPVVTHTEAERLAVAHSGLPQYPDQRGVKLSLAWILDHVVHAKGLKVGGAFVWDAQPLVIATERGATANDVRALAALVQEKVFAHTALHIVPEVNFL
ncbi:MAG: UDP-N-acetylmuramate dehydrogenase [Patescibacteria group bacterium]